MGLVLGIVAFIALANAITGETRPIWDGRRYYDLSLHRFDGRLVAPFCYRPAMPMLVLT